ncbi:hypothetical protein Anas_00304 [Armadillidium nasatum]|uniref:Uncharacterized protein n=1 Tax=Armadillidium nasatum TaxID=96803 RepID=A0A5N5THG8_9CRUS|nr:hypothetical protein Anas_00304 [Armadillidium nasatum]
MLGSNYEFPPKARSLTSEENGEFSQYVTAALVLSLLLNDLVESMMNFLFSSIVEAKSDDLCLY